MQAEFQTQMMSMKRSDNKTEWKQEVGKQFCYEDTREGGDIQMLI